MPPSVNTRVSTHPDLTDVAVEMDINLTETVTHAKVIYIQLPVPFIHQCSVAS